MCPKCPKQKITEYTQALLCQGFVFTCPKCPETFYDIKKRKGADLQIKNLKKVVFIYMV